METKSRSRPAIRRGIVGTTLGFVLAAVMAVFGGSPAMAGLSGHCWLGTNGSSVSVQQVGGFVNATYHIDVWYAATGVKYFLTGDYVYRGGTREYRPGPTSAVAGKRLCAQLWYNNPNTGGWESQGLPCFDY